MEFSVSTDILVVLFFIVALAYSSVGLGGGSSYTALMAVFGVSTLVIPMVSLTLNLCVTSIGSFNFIRNRHARINLILPFLITSIPMAYLGGSLKLPKEVFYWILFISLVFVAIRIYFWQSTAIKLDIDKKGKMIISLIAGSILGLVAGIVGIGGGIYLVPLIMILGLGTGKEAAACGSIFIWLNSLSGLISRFQYNSIDLTAYVPFIAAVFLGGTIGSFMGSCKFSPRTMERVLGGVIIVAIIFLGNKIFVL
ncbi:MAG TPA: sulfite exporter TauE/SafE family protein [Nitrospirae bacterium]|nr:sulfite exporter TauE/SafE [bacterium BMS3Abin09]GBE40404.1 sulfite exporter TauE/SafE [bacterium BMS3Bbin09]HDH34538.1 sulfite exporter TauE/SafE family protein [Nitrospirota bacterium]HDN95399.1 sulfite exporter TauE/SafE family protein [Nitrospirota bacterium]HDO66861.1 sulfite exporter TauE/SafE family protein [Nitrospirota bacterium]